MSSSNLQIPSFNFGRRSNGHDASRYHQDGGASPWRFPVLALRTNIAPTEIQWHGRMSVDRFTVLDNTRHWHRRPRDARLDRLPQGVTRNLTRVFFYRDE